MLAAGCPISANNGVLARDSDQGVTKTFANTHSEGDNLQVAFQYRLPYLGSLFFELLWLEGLVFALSKSNTAYADQVIHPAEVTLPGLSPGTYLTSCLSRQGVDIVLLYGQHHRAGMITSHRAWFLFTNVVQQPVLGEYAA